MLLTAAELNALAGLVHQSPHTLLGMHPLGDGSGVVARALVPGAAKVVLTPTHDASKPSFPLERLPNTDVFEGTTGAASAVYAYDLTVTDEAGQQRKFRDAYSFWPTLGETDLHLFNEGNHRRIYDALGAHLTTLDGVKGVSFAVWAPNARRVSVVGSFNDWDGRRHAMRLLGSSGVWEIFVPDVAEGDLYKFELLDAQGQVVVKTDPFGTFFELPPKQAAIVWDTRKFRWSDDAWLNTRRETNALRSPMSIYEIHLGSWQKKSGWEAFSYSELATPLIEYVRRLGFTHVEFLPVAEHAFYPSWGYQVTGFYAPTSRYGTPEDFQYLVNALHGAGIGVIVDWVPAHFPRDTWALAQFDGTALFEHADPKQGAHQDWGTLIFNFGRHEVRNFLAANALYWCERFHIDGLRVDAVASMLYLDYSRQEGEWIPNKYGGRENLEAVDFLRHVNHLIGTEHPGVVTIAEESTSWPMVSRPPWLGGLGFTLKWNMGWMHDTLGYFKRDPIHRRYHQNDLTFAMLYHYHENFVLPLSHDEVVHGKGSLRKRMAGDDWQAAANLRLLLGYQWIFPGKKLLFMGGEFGQVNEWNANAGLDWWLLSAGPFHLGVQRWVSDLNAYYLSEPALWRGDYDQDGFWWVDCSDNANSILSFIRHDRESGRHVLAVMNLTPNPLTGYRVGLPVSGQWREVLNSNAALYAGSDQGNPLGVTAEDYGVQNQRFSALFTLPPLSLSVFATA
ncbi:MAG TPA: 1,4-alpha-glucan branching protein GlgB [Candidatus Limnocylindria bacterium]|nr:1,4-alpha-glucan branching protein GlgB [Candidatus Limnocylindria bacterium]